MDTTCLESYLNFNDKKNYYKGDIAPKSHLVIDYRNTQQTVNFWSLLVYRTKISASLNRSPPICLFFVDYCKDFLVFNWSIMIFVSATVFYPHGPS